MLVGRSQVQLGNQSRPTQPAVEPKATEGLTTGRIVCEEDGGIVEAMTSDRHAQTADRHWRALSTLRHCGQAPHSEAREHSGSNPQFAARRMSQADKG